MSNDAPHHQSDVNDDNVPQNASHIFVTEWAATDDFMKWTGREGKVAWAPVTMRETTFTSLFTFCAKAVGDIYLNSLLYFGKFQCLIWSTSVSLYFMPNRNIVLWLEKVKYELTTLAPLI